MTTSLDDFCAKGWSDHADQAGAVFERLGEGVGLVAEAKDLPPLAGLIVHVAGEHLGRWPDGIVLLERLRNLPCFDPSAADGKAVLRSLAILHACAGDAAEAEALTQAALSGEGIPEDSDRARILAIVAFERALLLADYGPGPTDPAARALAVTGNNLAAEIETREHLSVDEKALMLMAARAARRYWGIAGG